MRNRFLLSLTVMLFVSCASPLRSGVHGEGGPIEVVMLQMNDVYEIGPIEDGKFGGLARVATLRKELLAKNPRVMTVLAGDFLNPSALGTSAINGVPLAGRQMVDSLNVMGLDLAVFGNHEFDLRKDDLAERIREAKFQWIAGNVRDTLGRPYAGLPTHYVREFRGDGGAKVRVGFVSVTLDSNRKDYVRYLDPLSFMRDEVKQLRPQVDVLIAVTHQAFGDDLKLAESVPGIDLIMGGHEHVRLFAKKGDRMIPVAKADANAKSVYLHVIRFDPKTRETTIDSSIRDVDASVSEEPNTARVVKTWIDRAYAGFRAAGFEPMRVVAQSPELLDGTEGAVRSKSTALTQTIARSLVESVTGADLALYNGGSIRIDDIIPPGPVTEYDVIRILPFGGTVYSMDVKGSVVQKLLDRNERMSDTGMFLQTANVGGKPGAWLINGEPIDARRSYRVATNDYCAKIWKADAEPDSRRDLGVDVRQALIRYMREHWGR